MANWAIVIGVNEYWTPQASLAAAIPDALRMREWLLNRKGGAVPSQNVFLLLSPRPKDLPASIKSLPATYEMIVKVIENVVQRSGGSGDRFFFHYSGHGLSAWVNYSEEDALVPSDFTPQFTTKSLSLRSILEYFGATQLREQFFFIDACRNIPWEGDFRIGYMPSPMRRAPGKAAVQQFVFYATSPGVKAAESTQVGDEQGAFTGILLKGLEGNGNAKVWNFSTDEYLVKVNRLFDHLVTEMEKKKVLVGKAGSDLFQVPRLGGERGAISGSDPILARFPAAAIPDESLEIIGEPLLIEAHAAIEIKREETTVERVQPITSVPHSFKLRPKEYVLVTEADGFLADEQRKVVDLYDSQQVTIKLSPKPHVTAVMRGGVEEIGVGKWVNIQGRFITAPLDTLVVFTSESFVPLEIASSAGEILKIGHGEVRAENLEPGFYRVRLVLPEARPVEKVVEFSGKTQLVHLESPAPALSEILFDVSRGGYLNEPRGERSSLQLFVRTETADSKQFRVRLWTQTESRSDSEIFSASRESESDVAYFYSAAQPGDHWLVLEFADQKAVALAVRIFPFQRTLVMINVAATAIQVYQYLLTPQPETLVKLYEIAHAELMQRFYLNGRLDHAYEAARLLLKRWPRSEAFVYCLAGYLALRAGMTEHARDVIEQLADFANHFDHMRLERRSDLSDRWVLQAELEAMLGNHEQAAAAYHEALNHGLPVVSEGLVMLLEGLQRYEIEHPRKNLLLQIVRRRVPGVIWSAWAPDSISAEEFL